MNSFAVTDIATLVPIFILVGALFYFSNREIRQSLEQSKKTQALLTEDRSRLVQKLIESRQEAREMRLARLDELAKAAEFGKLSQGLFHDLMTPLTSIILQTEKMKDSPEALPNVEKAIEASRRMALYIKDIRTTLSQEEAERECVLLEELESVIHLHSYGAREKGVEIMIVEKDACTWHGSPMKLRQIFSNLISNALDSFEDSQRKDGRVVEISLIKTADSNTIRVSDNGSGIPPEHISKIFNPFFTTKAFDKGTGIGLTTVKSIVEKNLSGTIEVESELGKGTTFTISFPTLYTDPAASPPPPHTPPRLV